MITSTVGQVALFGHDFLVSRLEPMASGAVSDAAQMASGERCRESVCAVHIHDGHHRSLESR